MNEFRAHDGLGYPSHDRREPRWYPPVIAHAAVASATQETPANTDRGIHAAEVIPAVREALHGQIAEVDA